MRRIDTTPFLLHVLCAALLCALFVPLSAHAQDGRIEGTIVERSSGEALAGATVQIRELNVGVATDGDGRFELAGIPAGDHVVLVSFVGFESAERLVELQPGATVTLEIALDIGLAE